MIVNNKNRLTNISIPSGTIKSLITLFLGDSNATFQFLLVRLKELDTIKDALAKNISIPSGTIKSNMSRSRKKAIYKFQFLLVRLKVIITEQQLKNRINFNSFWYD